VRVFGLIRRVLIRCCSFPIGVVERMMFNYDDKPLGMPIFIIGAPRTGSTILYQALTNAYKIGYIDNTACTWHRNLRFGMWLSRTKYGDSPHNNFRADHGNTQEFGGHAPSECGGFWYRWLPKDRHFVDHQDVTTRMVNGIRSEILGVTSYLGKPLLFKNLNAGQRLRLIKRAFPDAKILFIRRDPRFVIRSILKSRSKAGINATQWWSIMPPNFEELSTLPELEMCGAQVYFIEKQIEEDLALFPIENVKEIHYQDLDASLIEDLAQWIGVNPRSEGSAPEFLKDSIDSLANDELETLNRIALQYPFRKELFI
jgi:hypothetical protein